MTEWQQEHYISKIVDINKVVAGKNSFKMWKIRINQLTIKLKKIEKAKQLKKIEEKNLKR